MCPADMAVGKSGLMEASVIIPADETNLLRAATIHSISWQESHRAFCTPEFVELHTPERQRDYLLNKMRHGSRLFMLIDDQPVGIVTVCGSLIEDLYVLPDRQNMGYGTRLLQCAIEKCAAAPTLWALENNDGAMRLYRRMGFIETGRKNQITDGLAEIEFTLA